MRSAPKELRSLGGLRVQTLLWPLPIPKGLRISMRVASGIKSVEWRFRGVALLVLATMSGLVWGTPLRACASDVDLPPFVLTSRSGFTDGVQNTGLAVNVLQRALRRSGREPALIERLPWRRCREAVASGEFQIAIDVPTQELDARRFVATDAFAEVHHVYFYSPKAFPKGPPLLSVSDLKRYRICAPAGSNLDTYGIDRNRQDTGARDARSAIVKVAAGRCDVFMEFREVVDSLFAHDANLRDLFNDSGIRRVDMPEEASIGLHFEFSSQMLEARALQQSFNATIRFLIDKGEMLRMTP